VAFAEIEPFPCAVLKHHYPHVPNWGDLTRFQEWPDAVVDVLVGGTPCQSFSVAGLRKGLADPRGNLALTYLAVLDRYRPTWCVWENVPGVLSADDGRALGAFLGGLGELGYGFAYRVLDAQYFGLAQRRARVFVVGHLGDWRRAAAVLFERASLSGHPAPRREAGEAAPTLPSRGTAGGGLGTDFDCDGGLIAKALTASCERLDSETETFVVHALRADGFDASEDGTGRGTPLIAFSVKDHGADCGSIAPTLRSGGHDRSHANGGVMPAVAFAFHENQRAEVVCNDTAGSLKVGGGKPGQGYPAALHGMQVRRLTPRECERLQGFPDDYTLIPLRRTVRKQRKNEPDSHYAEYLANVPMAKDGPRYKALGNSMAVPVMRWIGQRLAGARRRAEVRA
jgi:DNA (cytosine-5)-methyltransferase 1